MTECERTKGKRRTEGMAAAQLWLLGILGLQFFANAVEQLDVALLRVLLQRCDKGPGHGTRGLAGDLGILPVSQNSSVITLGPRYSKERREGVDDGRGEELTKSVYPWNQTTSQHLRGKSWSAELFRSLPRLWWLS